MNLLFIQGGSRLKQTQDGRWFTDPNFTEEVWRRYMTLCETLIIVLRREKHIYSLEEAEKRFNPIPQDKKIKIIPLDDVTNPKWNMMNPLVKSRIKKDIAKAVSSCDKAIIRSCSFYTIECYRECIKQSKPYLLEVAGLVKEGLWFHSLMGKMCANAYEKAFIKMAHESSHAIYVTDEALQKRYPSKGKMLGCSDVVIKEQNKKVLETRLMRYAETPKQFIVGTAAFLDVKWKGQENVIKALAELKKKGITNIHYEMIGMGKGTRLHKLVKKLNLEEQVHFMGAMNHEQVFEWLKRIDIYIQPSYQEGLCRAIVEAMSCACPVICSDIGGNYELIDRDFIFNCGDYQGLASLIIKMKNRILEQAKINLEKSKKYQKERLDNKRNMFFQDFVNS